MKQRINWFMAGLILALGALLIFLFISLGKSSVGLLIPSASGQSLPPPPIEVYVEVPPQYVWEDGTPLVPRTDYIYTKVDYGPCSGDDQMLVEILGGTVVLAGQTLGKIFYVPRNREFCAVATVMSPTRQPLGHSNVAQFSTFTVRPNTPVHMRF